MFRSYIFVGFCCLIPSSSLALQFLEWGDKCEIPTHGGGSGDYPREECNAGKGLVCVSSGSGQACECTFKQRYSYDPVAQECRRRVGKPCQYVDVTTEQGRNAMARFPFNLKCHENAECDQLQVPVAPPPKTKGGIKFQASGGVPVEFETVSMCVCKDGFVATSDFNTCIVPPPLNPIADMFKEPKGKLTFRPPYYTS